jgi:uncharacterized repeat protein (TIGR03803 family)
LRRPIPQVIYKLLYSFGTFPDGAQPRSGLANLNGTLYGTTAIHGTQGYGTVFKVSTTGSETVLHNFLYDFQNMADGNYPVASLINVNDELYGTTAAGGDNNCEGGNGCETVFKVSTSGTESVLHRFQAGSDGFAPSAALTYVKGAFYGTTTGGGDGYYYGTVFKLSMAGSESVIYSFQAGADGATPNSTLINVNGGLFGTTAHGGLNNCTEGCGTVFAVSTSGIENVLYRFQGGADGVYPLGLINMSGKFYGTTNVGGASNEGSVFEPSQAGKESILYSFKGGTDGVQPEAGLIAVNGTLYGTTYFGGTNGCNGGFGCGTIYSIGTSGEERVLYQFKGGADGAYPVGDLLNIKGRLYGTTSSGGAYGNGTVFALTL